MTRVSYSYVLGKYPSKSNPDADPYSVQLNISDEAGKAWLSCNCKGWTTSAKNRGLEVWERSCSHTGQAQSDYAGEIATIFRKYAKANGLKNFDAVAKGSGERVTVPIDTLNQYGEKVFKSREERRDTRPPASTLKEILEKQEMLRKPPSRASEAAYKAWKTRRANAQAEEGHEPSDEPEENSAIHDRFSNLEL